MYHVGQEFEPSSIRMVSGNTTAPPLLTEADLIALMDKHGIGKNFVFFNLPCLTTLRGHENETKYLSVF